MVRLILDTQTVTIKGASTALMKKLDAATSYKVQGYFMHPAYRARRWDGKEHLITFDPSQSAYRAPIGLLADLKAALEAEGADYAVKVRARPERERVAYEWNPKVVMRDYQLAAVDAFSKAGGRGILKMPIRSGKTKTTARIIFAKQARALIMVPSQLLLKQTADSIRECFPGAGVGVIGDGQWEHGDITVATVQTLCLARGNAKRKCKGNQARDLDSGMLIDKVFVDVCDCGKKRCKGGRTYRTVQDPRYAELMAGHDLVVFDECHHLKGEGWREVMLDSPARLRLGLSATAYLDHAREVETGVIWLKACCGDIVYEVDTSMLIERGFLMRQEVFFYKCSRPLGFEGEGWSQTLLKRGIYENVHRNKLIAALARRFIQEGHLVLIASNRKQQVAAIDRILDRNRMEHLVIVGTTSPAQREIKLRQFRRGEVPLLVGTVFGEGVDIPEVSVVINAEGGRDAKATVQRMRNMTPSEGKTRSIMIDFWDDFNPHFRRHARARYKTYTTEKAFIVQKMW
jgi:superfamily II DNA or RNA helicase